MNAVAGSTNSLDRIELNTRKLGMQARTVSLAYKSVMPFQSMRVPTQQVLPLLFSFASKTQPLEPPMMTISYRMRDSQLQPALLIRRLRSIPSEPYCNYQGRFSGRYCRTTCHRAHCTGHKSPDIAGYIPYPCRMIPGGHWEPEPGACCNQSIP
jgi:hypothetical protein